METIVDVLDTAASVHPERDAYVFGDRRITYRELHRMSAGFAFTLRELGVTRGDVVSLMIPSSIEFAACYLGAIRVGAITSAINSRLGAREQASIIERTTPSVTVSAAAPAHSRQALGEVLTIDDLPSAFERPSFDRDAELAANDTVAVVWTSGTTGVPKGARYDHAAMHAIHEGMGDISHPGDRRVVSLPFAHVGYMTRVWDDLANGITMVLVGEPWSAREQLRLITDERITFVTGVPTQWSLMMAHDQMSHTDTSSVRLLGIGGAAVPPELVRQMRATFGCPVMTRYTSTEAGLATGTQLTDADETIATTVGVPSSIVRMRIVDPASNRDVEAGAVGEIRLRSDAMFRGYWNDPEQSAAALDDDGYLRTGDLGRVGDDGNLRIVGRLKEMYIRGGYNIYPVEIEGVLGEHPAVHQAAVVGAPAPVLGEIGVAFVVLAPGTSADTAPTLEELREWCRARLADYKAPDRLSVVAELPVNAMHKIDKAALLHFAKDLV